MRSFTTTLLTAFLLLFFSTATSAKETETYKYRLFPYSLECDGKKPTLTREQMRQYAVQSVSGDRGNPEYYFAKNFDNAGNCNKHSKFAELPLFKETGANGLTLYFCYGAGDHSLIYCNYELNPKHEGDYKTCNNNYNRHTWGADVPQPPQGDEYLDDGKTPTRRARWARRG